MFIVQTMNHIFCAANLVTNRQFLFKLLTQAYVTVKVRDYNHHYGLEQCIGLDLDF